MHGMEVIGKVQERRQKGSNGFCNGFGFSMAVKMGKREEIAQGEERSGRGI